MENNELKPYKEGRFEKITLFLKRILKKKNKAEDSEMAEIQEKNIRQIDKYELEEGNKVNVNKQKFRETIQIKTNTDVEESRIKELQKLYENGEIDEEDMSEADIDKIVNLYREETEMLNRSTEQIEKRIEKMLNEMNKD